MSDLLERAVEATGIVQALRPYGVTQAEMASVCQRRLKFDPPAAGES